MNRTTVASALPAIRPFLHRTAESRLVFGDGELAKLPAELEQLQIRRPVVLCSPSVRRSPLYEEVKRLLAAIDCVFLDTIPQHSSTEAVTEICRLAREHRTDGFITVGGGSVSDSAKAAALWLAEGGNLEDHASQFTPPDKLHIPELRQPKLPIVTIPCTASGAEVTSSLGIRTVDKHKLLFWDIKLASSLVLIDPVANLCVPASIMLSTGMNGLAHCIEGLYSKVRSPITDAFALHALRLFVTALPGVAQDPTSSARRADLLMAAHLSGLVLANARTALHHAICHAIGAMRGVAHGEANAVMLPHVMRFNAEAADNAMQAIVAAWPAEAGDKRSDAVERVRALRDSLGVPTRLRDLGIERDMLPAVAATTMSERGVYFNPRRIENVGQIAALLEAAW